MNSRYHNQAPSPNGSKVKKALAVGALLMAGAGAATGAVAHERGVAKEAAKVDKQLEAIINPVIDAHGREALDVYGAQPDKGMGNIHLIVDAKKGVATIAGQAKKELVVDDQNFGSTVTDMRVVMGLQGGAPNPDDTRYAWYSIGNLADGNVTAKTIQFAAPGAEKYRSGLLPGDREDGWSAASGTAIRIGDSPTRGGQTSTDNRDSWAGEPDPLLPAVSAHKVIVEANEVVPEVLAVLNAPVSPK